VQLLREDFVKHVKGMEEAAEDEEVLKKWCELTKVGWWLLITHRCLQCICLAGSVCDTCLHVNHAGSADSIALLGLAEALECNFVFLVPPKDEAKVSSNSRHHYSTIVASTVRKDPPTVYLGILCGHFQALEKPKKTIAAGNTGGSVVDLMARNVCPATAKCLFKTILHVRQS
jgi:hypothetical protein